MRPTSQTSCIGFVRHMFFHCHEVCLHWFFCCQKPGYFPEIYLSIRVEYFLSWKRSTSGRIFWRSSNRLRSILSKLCISVPLSTSCTDLTMKSNFRRTAGVTSSQMIHCQLLPVRFKQDASGLRTKYTFKRNGTVYLFIFREFDRLCFSKFSGREIKQNCLFLQRILPANCFIFS